MFKQYALIYTLINEKRYQQKGPGVINLGPYI